MSGRKQKYNQEIHQTMKQDTFMIQVFCIISFSVWQCLLREYLIGYLIAGLDYIQGTLLVLSMLGKIFRRRHFELFILIFSHKIGFEISCKLSHGDNLHEISKPISWEKLEKYNQFIVC